MKPRDLAIVAAVIAIAGFAAADALRSSGVGTPSRPKTTSSEPERARLSSVPAPGSLVFTDQSDRCRLREIDVGTGLEFPLPRIETTCEMSAAPAGSRLAYGLPVSPLEGDPEVKPFGFVDLVHTARELGAFEAVGGLVVWSPDGQRAAWCDGNRHGFDYEVGRDVARLAHCPRGYTTDGAVVRLEGRRIVAGGRTVYTSPGFIDHFAFGQDGSLAVLFDGIQLERWENGRRTSALRLPAAVQGYVPTFAPDNCRAFFAARANVHVVDLGCPGRGVERRWAAPGTTAAWSPNARWLAVADLNEVAIYRVEGGEPVARWPFKAHALAWR
jgi:hypothetical protein